MKKINKILVVLVFCLILFITSACLFTKDAIDSTKFTSIMTKNQFKVTDVTDQYTNYDYISSVQVAISENNEYQIEFYKLDSIENAKKMYESNKLDFEEEERSISAFTSNVDMGNFNTFSLSDATSYRYICRVDDTLIYVKTTKDYQNKVKKMIDELGY